MKVETYLSAARKASIKSQWLKNMATDAQEHGAGYQAMLLRTYAHRKIRQSFQFWHRVRQMDLRGPRS